MSDLWQENCEQIISAGMTLAGEIKAWRKLATVAVILAVIAACVAVAFLVRGS